MKNNEVNIINGAVVGVHLGAPMQDATPAKPEDNEVYATERNTVTRIPNSVEIWDEQPVPSGGGSGGGAEITEFYIESGNKNAVWKNPDDVGSDTGKASYDEVVAATNGIIRLVEFYYDETYAHDVVGFTVFSNAVELLVAQYSTEVPVKKYLIQK